MTDKPYPNEALAHVCKVLLEYRLTLSQIRHLVKDIPDECEAIEEEAGAQEEQSLDYFNRYIAGDR